jgi:hypothetical protein
MFNEKSKSADSITAAISTANPTTEQVHGGGVFSFQCFDKDGNLKWEEQQHNLVMTAGAQDMNAKYFEGASYSATWYIGLIQSGSFTAVAAGDLMNSHTGWVESTVYSQATRPACDFGTPTNLDPSVIANSVATGGTVAVFSINATPTGNAIQGAFLTSNNVKAGTTGILFSASSFTAPGARTVVSGDTLNVTYTFSLDQTP